MSEPPQPYATPRNYDALVVALDRRRIELGWSHVDLDQIIGYENGRTGKYLSPSQTKKLGAQSLWLFIDALGLDFALIVNPGKTAKYGNRAITGNPRQARPNHYAVQPSKRIRARVARFSGDKGRKSYREKTAPELRSAVARHAAMKRWYPNRPMDWNEVKAAAQGSNILIPPYQTTDGASRPLDICAIARAADENKAGRTHPTAAKRGPVRRR